jgi:transcription termination/antitermination protein NusG
MNYYAIQVLTRQEEKFIKLSERRFETLEKEGYELTGRLLWPRRSLTIKRRGKQINQEAPIFPGYLFWEAPELEADMYWIFKRTTGFIRFLKDNQNIDPLSGASERLLLHFLHFGEVVGKSKVTFDAGDRIVVESGPMEGLEGKIKKVDKRKGRAKVELNLYEKSFLVDFGFDIISKPREEKDDKR